MHDISPMREDAIFVLQSGLNADDVVNISELAAHAVIIPGSAFQGEMGALTDQDHDDEDEDIPNDLE